MIRRMRVVAKSRFAANKRLEAKAHATMIGLQVANIYTIAIGILLIQFQGSLSIAPIAATLNYVSLIASVFVQIMALIENFKNYGSKAKDMHDCAMRVNDLHQNLELETQADWRILRWYQQQYHLAIKDYAVNHDQIDYEAALLEHAAAKGPRHVEMADLWWWRVRYACNVYGLTALILVSPIAVGVVMLQLGLN